MFRACSAAGDPTRNIHPLAPALLRDSGLRPESRRGRAAVAGSEKWEASALQPAYNALSHRIRLCLDRPVLRADQRRLKTEIDVLGKTLGPP